MADDYTINDMDEIKFVPDDPDDYSLLGMGIIPEAPEFEEYHLCNNYDTQSELFIDELFAAFDTYHKTHDWIALSNSVWSLFVKYIGFHRVQSDAKHVRMLKRYEAQAKQYFSNTITYCFQEFYRLPQQEAIFALTGLLGDLKADRDYESLCGPLTESDLEKYNIFINRIEGEIRKHQMRTNLMGQSLSDHVIGSVPKSFHEFCLKKIDEMDDEDRRGFLLAGKGDQTHYDLRRVWVSEYEKLPGKKKLKNPAAEISRAKKEYRELKKN